MPPFALLLMIAPPQAAELAPLGFLVGHCWRGALNAQESDTHCFKVVGAEVHDRHDVVRDGKTVYWGVTVYRWDAATGRIAFVYSDPSGEVGRGSVRADGADLDFGTNDYGTGAQKVSITSRWVRTGANAYDAVDSAPGNAKFNRTTRYIKVD